MATVAVETFFRTLPPGRLTVDEERLRKSLQDTCSIAAGVLPRHVPLQQWVERRMPGELNLAIDGSGWVNLWKDMLPPVARTTRSGTPDVVIPPVQQVSRRDNDKFFKSLPADRFTPEEEDLREAILAELAPDGKLPAHMVIDARNVKHHSKFLPPNVLLEEWAEQRMGSELLFSEDKHGERFFKIRDKQRDEQRDAFFDSLPRDSFSPDEMRLREVIHDFMASKRGELVTLAMLGSDHVIGAAKRAVLQKGISLREWVENRVASEFNLERDGKGQWNIFCIGEQDDEYPAYPGESVRDSRADRAAQKEADIAKREQWLNELPDGSYTDTEIALREAILEFLDKWHSANDSPPTLSQAGGDDAVRAARTACLPKHTSLRDWIDHRVGGEIESVPSDHSTETFFGLRGKVDYEAVRRVDEGHKQRKLARWRDGEDGKAKGKGKGKVDGKGKRGPPPIGKGKSKHEGAPPKRRRV